MRKDGSEFPAEISLSNIEIESGSVAITAIRDITERLASERRFEQEREEHRRATLAAMVEAERAETARMAAERRLERQDDEHRRTIVTAMLEAEEAERSRVATALHDDTVQVMTAGLVALDRLLRVATQNGDTTLAPVIEDVRTTLAQATERTRRLTFELRPAVLHELGIAAAVHAIVAQAGREIGAEVSVQIPDGRFDWPVEELLYRTVQEAIANVRKHSRARRITVVIALRDDRLVGEVADDGRGFDVARATDSAAMILHFGLGAMIERVRMAGGGIRIDSQPGHGTRVTFDVPATPQVTFPAPTDPRLRIATA